MSHRAVVPLPAAVPADTGFVLIEAVIAVALIAIAATAALAAATAVTHATAKSLPSAALTATAQNVLTDLRAATAYDPDQLAALAGRSVTFTATEPGPAGAPVPVAIRVSVAHAAPADTYVGSVTARAVNGTEVTVTRALVQEAPAPGAVLRASPPVPVQAAPNDTGTLETIAL